MIGYVTLGTSDLPRAAKFYDALCGELGVGRMMDALEAADEAQVQRLYDIALANGGTDEGAPGPRGDNFYAGYFRDPDGNKLNAFLMKP
jgi:predicted lactoylglutathione lyase